jgi:hypothetical protein
VDTAELDGAERVDEVAEHPRSTDGGELQVEAQVAEATIDDQIEGVQLDVDLRREQLRRARIESDIAEQELLRKRIENAHALEALNAQRRQQALVEHFIASGELDQADAIAAADPLDAAALIEFAVRPPQLETANEADPDADDAPQSGQG